MGRKNDEKEIVEESCEDSCCQQTDESELKEQFEELQENCVEDDPIAILEHEKEELKNAYLRLSAETDNYRKRIQQEKESFKKTALKDIIEKLLPVIDNLERSIEAAKTSDNIESLREGVEMILAQFEGVLRDTGLETIQLAEGDEFDPQYCEAVMMEEKDDLPYSMTIVDVFEVGRKLGGQIIRTAKVKVAKKKS
ncbi:MAG: nucleotide exchange factor GrpE [Brevinema sp.]